MSVDDSTFLNLAALLQRTLTDDAQTRKSAESELLRMETCKNYGVSTLLLTRRPDVEPVIRVSAAIAFKNFIKRNWKFDPNDETTDKADLIDAQERQLIKQHITSIMIESKEHIQRQLSDAMTIIGQCDFPDKWPSLIGELVASIQRSRYQDYDIINGVLQTAHSIFRHYRHEYASDRLWTEIKYVLDNFAQSFTELFVALMAASKGQISDATTTRAIYSSLVLCAKIFHSLNIQDLPAFFEDHIDVWMSNFLELLSINRIEALETSDDEVGLMEQLRSEICEIASLYVQKYSSEFINYREKVAESIWRLLTLTGHQTKYDLLVSNAIRFLITVAERPESRHIFQDPKVLNSLCQQVIIPNMEFREADEELFEDNPEEYIRKDIEGSDVDTRRRASCELVKALSRNFEREIVDGFSQYIIVMLNNYSSNKKQNWKSKDVAVFLVTSMAVKGASRQHGTTSVSSLVNIEDFYKQHILCDLDGAEGDLDQLVILRADALKFITTFRNQLSLELLIPSLPLIIKHLRAPNIVVHTYAAITIEKLLTMRDAKQTRIAPNQLEPFIESMITALFEVLNLPGSQENDHVMKAIMRLFSFADSRAIVPFLPNVVPKIISKLVKVADNPSRPFFNHYLFETLALTIRATYQQNRMAIKEFEEILFQIMENIRQRDVQEFMPYIFELLDLVLRYQERNAISENFQKLLENPELLGPTLWERAANIRPLTGLLQTYIEKDAQTIVSQNKLLPLLGVFQKLISSKATDHEGLALLQSMISHIQPNVLDTHIRQIFLLCFQRLSGSKTTKFVRNVLVCFSLYAFVRGPQVLASTIDSIQDKMFGMVLEKLYVQDVQKVTGIIERRICISAMVKILVALPFISEGSYNNLWASLLQVLVAMLELPEVKTENEDDEHFSDIENVLTYQAQYSRLIFASKRRIDPTGNEVQDPRLFLAQSLKSLSTQSPGLLPKLVAQTMSQEAIEHINRYCQAANITLV